MDPDTGRPKEVSPFGEIRFSIIPIALLNQQSNLYFSDFYCNSYDVNKHYVLLIITKQFTSQDDFCKQKLIPLNKYDNPFLYIKDDDEDTVYVSKNVWVEVFYTSSVDLNKLLEKGLCKKPEVVESTGYSRIEGRGKNEACSICNLYKPGTTELITE